MALALTNHGRWQAENSSVQIFRIQSRWMDGCGEGNGNGGVVMGWLGSGQWVTATLDSAF